MFLATYSNRKHKTRNGWELKNRSVASKYNHERKMLTKALYDLTGNADLLPRTLFWKHDLKKPFLKQNSTKSDVTKHPKLRDY